MGKLEGKVALITGAARGQGEAEARLFVEEGARVVLGDVLDELGKNVAESLGTDAIYCHHDVSQTKSWADFTAAARSAFGRIDVLVNNAAILRTRSIAEISREEYMSVIEVNQVGTLLGMQAVLPSLIESRGGSIVNISSVAGLGGLANMVAYVSSKFAVRGMTKTAAIEFGRYGIRVNSVHPGGVDTPMVAIPGEMEGQDTQQERQSNVLLGRIGKPMEMARLVAFLASDDSSYCTGSEFTADGGMMCRVPME